MGSSYSLLSSGMKVFGNGLEMDLNWEGAAPKVTEIVDGRENGSSFSIDEWSV